MQELGGRVWLIFIGIFFTATLILLPIGLACFTAYWLLGKLENKNRKTYKREVLLDNR